MNNKEKKHFAKVACIYALMDLARDMGDSEEASRMRADLRANRAVTVEGWVTQRDRIAAVLDDLRITDWTLRADIFAEICRGCP